MSDSAQPSAIVAIPQSGVRYIRLRELPTTAGWLEWLLRLLRIEWTLPYGAPTLSWSRKRYRGSRGLYGGHGRRVSHRGARRAADLDRPGQRTLALVNDLTSDGKYYTQGLPAR